MDGQQSDNDLAPIPIGKGASSALLACGIFTTVGLFAPALLLPQIEKAFSNTPNAALLTQLIGGITCFFFAVGSPLAGILIGRIGSRAVILPSLVLFGLAGAAPAFLDSLSAIVATRALVGLAVAGVFTGALSGIGQAPETMRPRLFGGLSVTGGVAALLLFPGVAELAKIDWRWGFAVYLVGFLIIPLALLIPARLGRVAASGSGHTKTSPTPFLNKGLRGLLAVAVLIGMAMFIGGLYAPLYLSSELGITDTRLLAIPSTLGSAVSPIAAALYGKLYRRIDLSGVMVFGLAGLTVSFLLAGLAGELVLFSIAMLVGGIMYSLLAPNVSASALALSAPQHAASAIGLANGVMFGSQLLSPFAIGAVRNFGPPASVFYVFATVLATVALLTLSARRARTSSSRLVVEPGPS